ncbi:MAG: TonB-dependent receptor [Bacteroidia bacterium]|nr:TonB-dependent receptor [Bacteroidia bacterium]
MAQNEKIDLNLHNVTVIEAVKAVERQTTYKFVYSNADVDISRKVNINAVKESIESIAKIIFSGYDITVKGSNVIVTPHKSTNRNTGTQQVSQKTLSIKGHVVDEKGEPLVGVTIIVQGNPSLGTITDIDGNFTLSGVPSKGNLEISYIGMKTQVVEVNGRTTINIKMVEDSEMLDDVVVIGFGRQKKESVVSSISSVKPSDITVPTRNLTNSLAGQVAGLIAVQRSGEPGYDNAEFWIRGISTFAGGTSPLVLVDGVPRRMHDIEPDEIETFSILKDAAATAVYGAQGANGVVLVTTKRGKVERPKITFRTEHSISKPTRLPEFVGSVEYMELFNEAKRNDGEAPQFSEELINKYRQNMDFDLYPNTNWLDLMLRETTNNSRYTLNVRGGTQHARYFVSGAYYTESGLFSQNPTKKYDTSIGVNRFNLRSNVDMDVSPTTIINVDVSGQYLVNTFPGTGTPALFRSMLITPPYVFPAYYSDGTISTYPQERDSNMRNPWNLLMHSGYAKEWRTYFQSGVGLKQKLDFITSGLSFEGSISFDYDGSTFWRRTYNPTRYYATERNNEGDLIFSKVVSGDPDLKDPTQSVHSTRRIYIEGNLRYNRTFGDVHHVGGLINYNQREAQAHNNALAFRKQNIVGRVTYGYADRYFMEANFGYSGSETFAKGNRYGFFPAVGIAYYLSNEAFYPDALRTYLDKVKFKFSIGRSGNDDTGGERFLYRPQFKQDAGGFNQGIGDNGGTNGIGNGIYEERLPAPYLTWEIENKKNYSIELGFWKNRIQLVMEYFDNTRSGILLKRRTLPQVSGFRDDPWQNMGIVRNHGIDGSLDFSHKFGDIKIGTRGTFTFTRNKIIEYDELPTKYPWMAKTGTRVSENEMYIAERLYTNDDFIITTNANGTKSYILKDHLPSTTLGGLLGPGDIKYKDINGDGVIDSYDVVRGIGNPEVPEIVYGFGASIEYKGIYANIFFQGTGNTSVRLGGDVSEGWYPFSWGVDQSNFRTFARNRWTEENPSQNVEMPRLHKVNSTNANNLVNSTWWLRNGAFLRLKNIEVGYNFPRSMLKNLRIESARLYLMGYNLAVWDDIKYFDPETGNKNAGLNYPLPKTFSLGFEFSF